MLHHRCCAVTECATLCDLWSNPAANKHNDGHSSPARRLSSPPLGSRARCRAPPAWMRLALALAIGTSTASQQGAHSTPLLVAPRRRCAGSAPCADACPARLAQLDADGTLILTLVWVGQPAQPLSPLLRGVPFTYARRGACSLRILLTCAAPCCRLAVAALARRRARGWAQATRPPSLQRLLPCAGQAWLLLGRAPDGVRGRGV